MCVNIRLTKSKCFKFGKINRKPQADIYVDKCMVKTKLSMDD